VQTAVEAVQPIAFARQVRVDLRRDGMPVGRARGDARRVTRAITTLLSNAVHFAPSGSVVDVLVSTADGAMSLAVHDMGPGVGEGALPYLFDRTRPSDPARGSPRGDFRLGLGFVRDVVTGHGGRVEAESDGEDAGVTFRVTLPVSEPSVFATPPAVIPQQLGGLRVLLVDDEPDAREALEGILRHYGAVVRAAGSAADAVVVLQHEPVDVVLADIAMPGADGYDLIKSIRALDSSAISHVPAVAVTAFASEADRRRALDAGYQVHLSKPIDASALIATVAALGRPAARIP
jgi:CheY-like chemotaxis protein